MISGFQDLEASHFRIQTKKSKADTTACPGWLVHTQKFGVEIYPLLVYLNC